MLSPSTQKAQDFLSTHGLENRVVELPDTTRTSAEAATAIGCTAAQIAKSLIFRTRNTQKPVLVIASGANRINEKKIAEYLGELIERPDAEFVRTKTGFVIGGVPPAGHLEKLLTFVDQDLLQLSEIWAAAGTPNAVFKLSPEELTKITGGRVVGVT